MKSTHYLICSCCLFATVLAQTPEKKGEPSKDLKKDVAADAPKNDAAHKEAVEILKKVDDATKAVKAVRYNATAQGTGAAAARAPRAEGKVLMSGKDEQGTPKFRVEAKVQPPDSGEAKEYTAGHDGNLFYLIDPSKKMVYADIDAQILGGAGRNMGGLLMREFSHPTPFSDEINSVRAEIKGSKKIGDQDCYEILVVYREKPQPLEAIWYFSKKDYLPRRVDRLVTNAAGEKGAAELSITDLIVDPKTADDAFKLVVPDGFEKTDEFPASERRPQ